MRFAIALLILFGVAMIPTLFLAGGTSLRELGWLAVAAAAVVLLIDLTDRLIEWVEARRWGRRR